MGLSSKLLVLILIIFWLTKYCLILDSPDPVQSRIPKVLINNLTFES